MNIYDGARERKRRRALRGEGVALKVDYEIFAGEIRSMNSGVCIVLGIYEYEGGKHLHAWDVERSWEARGRSLIRYEKRCLDNGPARVCMCV